MNASEGLRRIATVFRVIGFVAGAAFLAIAIYSLVTRVEEWIVGTWFLVLGAACAAVCVGIAWIIEGFAAPRHAGRDRGDGGRG